jgi:hypothetical protein
MAISFSKLGKILEMTVTSKNALVYFSASSGGRKFSTII